MNYYLVEFIGTLLHAYVALATNNSVAIGLSLVILLILLQGTFNPAITFMLAYLGKVKLEDLGFILVSQILGAITAVSLYNLI